MSPEARQRILDRAANRKAQNPAVADPAPVVPTGPVTPANAAAVAKATGKTVAIARGDVSIRVIDADNPPTQVQSQSRGPGVRQRPAGTPVQQGLRTVGARVVSQESQQPGPRVRGARGPGQYGATVRPPEGVAAAPPIGQALRTPLSTGVAPQAPLPAQAVPGAPGVQGAAGASPDLTAQIQAMGAQQQRVGGAAGVAPVGVAPVAAAQTPVVTVIMSQHQRPATLEVQYRTLAASGVGDGELWCWVNPSGVRLNDGLLGRVVRFSANRDMGPWFRWSLVSCVPTKYTLVIDDDCTPGPQWISHAIQRLERAAAEGDKLVIVAAGVSHSSDHVDDVQLLGPESLHREEIDVDIGRGAWLMSTDLARSVLNFPQVGSLLSTAIHVAAATQNEGAQLVVLPYPHNDRHAWGMQEAPQTEGSMSKRIDNEARQGQGPTAAALRTADYDVFRSVGWEPLCVIAASATTVESEPQAFSPEELKTDDDSDADADAAADAAAAGKSAEA